MKEKIHEGCDGGVRGSVLYVSLKRCSDIQSRSSGRHQAGKCGIFDTQIFKAMRLDDIFKRECNRNSLRTEFWGTPMFGAQGEECPTKEAEEKQIVQSWRKARRLWYPAGRGRQGCGVAEVMSSMESCHDPSPCLIFLLLIRTHHAYTERLGSSGILRAYG